MVTGKTITLNSAEIFEILIETNETMNTEFLYEMKYQTITSKVQE